MYDDRHKVAALTLAAVGADYASPIADLVPDEAWNRLRVDRLIDYPVMVGSPALRITDAGRDELRRLLT